MGGGVKNPTGNNVNTGGGGPGSGTIPAGARKIVQSLKEIVNCPELEIYAMLKDCNMDPNETVNRLLSQDPFHEVKSKREKKKENKEVSEYRPRVASVASNRGRTGADRYAGRGGSSRYNSSDVGALHNRSAYKKEDVPIPYVSSLSSAPGSGGHSLSRRPPSNSEVAGTEDKFPVIGMTDNGSSVPRPSYGYHQAAWVGTPGQMSMADIVKMGKPNSKTAGAFNNFNQHQGSSSANNLRLPEDHTSKVSMENFEQEVSPGHHVSVDNEWPLIEPPLPTSIPSISETVDQSNLSEDTITRQLPTEEAQQVDEDPIEDHGASSNLSASVSHRRMQEDASVGAALFEHELYPNRASYQPQTDDVVHEEAQNVSAPVASVVADLHKLSINKEDRGLPSECVGPAVVIPDHLQAQSVDCSHLSFGSFGSGIRSFSRPATSVSVRSNSEETPLELGASSVAQSDIRNSEYYIEDPLGNESEANMFLRTAPASYDSSASQAETLKVENSELEHRSQYAFASSAPGHAFENSQQLNIGFSQSQTSSQMQNLGSFSNVMPSYSDSLPNTLLTGNITPGRDSDIPYSPFPVTQSMAAKYGNSVSSISGPTISMAEVLKAASFSSAQPVSQTLSGASVATGPAIPQHLAAHQYSQHALHLGPFANMIGYPHLLPQSYAYLPPNYPQAYTGNSTYPQNLAAVFTQYKNSSVSSLSQSASIATGYGAFGGSTTTLPGNFPMNPPSAPSAASSIYDDILSAQYKDSNHLMSLAQSDGGASWLQGHGSRTMSGIPSNTHYNYQGQTQQPVAGFRQAQQQQASQNYGSLGGYPNFYHSQTGISLDHQQQNPRDGSRSGSLGQAMQQSQQLWQNNY